MALRTHQDQDLFKGEDVARWITFSGFWGFIYYLLSWIGLLAGQRKQPLQVQRESALVGLGIHLGLFVTLGSLVSAVGAVLQGKSTTQQARERVGSGLLQRSILLQGLGGAVGSVIPFALTVGSLRGAERITRRAAINDFRSINWPVAIGTTALASGVTALAVSRIAAWVARDARRS